MIHGIDKADSISWTISDTKCNGYNLALNQYTEWKKYCTLAVGQSYNLECYSYTDWWKRNFLVIEDSVYCKYAKEKKSYDIKITGKIYH